MKNSNYFINPQYAEDKSLNFTSIFYSLLTWRMYLFYLNFSVFFFPLVTHFHKLTEIFPRLFSAVYLINQHVIFIFYKGHVSLTIFNGCSFDQYYKNIYYIKS